MIARSSGAWDWQHGKRYGRPLRPSTHGCSSVTVRPLSPSSMTLYSSPRSRCKAPGQRTTRGNRSSPCPSGGQPHVLESPKQRIVRSLNVMSLVVQVHGLVRSQQMTIRTRMSMILDGCVTTPDGRPVQLADPTFVPGKSHGFPEFQASCEAVLMGRTPFEP